MDKEKERELRKLLNVLRRMARTARMNHWMVTGETADAYSIEQYNRILHRLATLDKTTEELFAPLPVDASWSTLSNACRDLAAYYEDDAHGPNHHHWDHAQPEDLGQFIRDKIADKAAFRRGLPEEMQELGQFIREKIAEWQERKRTDPGPPRR